MPKERMTRMTSKTIRLSIRCLRDSGLITEVILRQAQDRLLVIAALAFIALIVFFALPPVNRLIVTLTARVTRREIAAPAPTFAHGIIPPVFSLAKWLVEGLAC